MTQTGPSALLMDIEGVVAHPDDGALDAALAALAPGLDAAVLDAARNRPETYPLWRAYSVGALTSRDYWSGIAVALGLTDVPSAADALSSAMRVGWWARLDDDVLDLLRAVRLRRGADRFPRLGILSNSAPEHEAHIPRFAALFDVQCFSHRIGARKPDAAAYRAAVAALDVPADAVVFVDDKPRNTDAASALGMRGVVFEGATALRALLVRSDWLAP